MRKLVNGYIVLDPVDMDAPVPQGYERAVGNNSLLLPVLPQCSDLVRTVKTCCGGKGAAEHYFCSSKAREVSRAECRACDER